MTACTHAVGRVFPDQTVREMLRALGVETCPRCHQAIRIHGPKGRSWVSEPRRVS